jgi:hypothetical protein
MIKKMYRAGALFIGAALLFSACTKDPDVEKTSTQEFSGEWFIEYYEGGAPVTDHHKILTYNTSDPNSGKVWVEDPDVWPFKAKFDVDPAALTFKAMNSAEDVANGTGLTIKVYEGKVLPKAGKSKSGNLVDSIYLKVEFSDDPGTVYEIKGHQRTGFFEDEY